MKKDKRKKEEILGISIIALGAFIFLSLISYDPNEEFSSLFHGSVKNYMGSLGIYIARFLTHDAIGYFAFFVPLFIFLWGWNQLKKKEIENLLKYTIYAFLFILYASTFIAMLGNPSINPESKAYEWSGGVGKFIAKALFDSIGIGGSILLLFMFFIFTLIWATGLSITKISDMVTTFFIILSRRTKRRYTAWQENRQSLPRSSISSMPKPFEKPTPKPKLSDSSLPEEPSTAAPEAAYSKEPASFIPDEGEKIIDRPEPKKAVQPAGNYEFPTSALFDIPPEQDIELTWEELERNGKILEDSLADFGVQGKVVETNPGPVITRFEIEPAPGVKVSKFTSLADDLARVMRAKRVRVIAPIPGKAAVGIELPNPKPEIVYLSELINSPEFAASKSPLTMILGKTIDGAVYTADLREMPHLLVAGATGSGKSVCINSIIISILFKAHPKDVQFVLIDPKRLELTPYSKLRHHHLVSRDDLDEDVITNPKNAISILKSMTLEMERRYQLLQNAMVRNIEEYNAKLEAGKLAAIPGEEPFEKLEYLILIIDELADLMLIAAKEIEEPVARLTQMSRAVGIHLIVATQRPSVDVITGVIKANFPARIGFQVASKTDSRTILDMNGAEKLLGRGDMLYLPSGSPEPVRIHGAYVSTDEVERVISHIKRQPRFRKFILQIEEEEEAIIPGLESGYQRDKLFNEAAKIVVHTGQGSVSILQRRLKVGYARAARLIDELEMAGIVGPFDGSKAREVLQNEEGLYEMGIY